MAASSKVSSFGQKILQKMASGRNGHVLNDGRLKAGGVTAPASLLNELSRLDLVSVDAGKVTLTSAGSGYLRRLKHLQKNCRKGRTIFPENPYRAQHSLYSVEEISSKNKTEKIVRNIGDSTLAWLMMRKGKDGRPFLNGSQFEAGEKLSKDYEYAGLITRTTAYYDGIPISGKTSGARAGDHQTVTQLAARQRVEAALKFVGPGLSDILVRVCCYHEGLEQAEKSLSWPTRSGKLVLRLALDRLVDHYESRKEPERLIND